jgi:2-polyprenyl-3-methyl-5-hydroxy-6-metoxy-1,4-benzoquinol methylase
VATRQVDELRQERYFEDERHRYPAASIVSPPVHTELELGHILDAVRGARDRGPVVDFGAGTGRLTIALARAGYPVVAVDLSRASLRELEDLAAQLALPNVDVATDLPDGPVLAVVGADVLHHVKLSVYLPRIHRMLRDGGVAVFSEPGALNPAWYVYLPLQHDIRVEKRIVTCNLATLRRSFRRHGFRNVSITGLGVLPRPLFGFRRGACRRHDRVGNWPGARWFAYRYIIRAEK